MANTCDCKRDEYTCAQCGGILGEAATVVEIAARDETIRVLREALTELTEAIFVYGPVKGAGTIDGQWLRVFRATDAAQNVLVQNIDTETGKRAR